MSAAPDSAEASCMAMVGLFAAAADHKLHGCFGKYGIQVKQCCLHFCATFCCGYGMLNQLCLKLLPAVCFRPGHADG
jgi:hypothetical protein